MSFVHCGQCVKTGHMWQNQFLTYGIWILDCAVWQCVVQHVMVECYSIFNICFYCINSDSVILIFCQLVLVVKTPSVKWLGGLVFGWNHVGWLGWAQIISLDGVSEVHALVARCRLCRLKCFMQLCVWFNYMNRSRLGERFIFCYMYDAYHCIC